MIKDKKINLRIDALLESEITVAAKKKKMHVSDYMREVLEYDSEMVLLGQGSIPEHIILMDIWKRVSFLQASVLERLLYIENGEELRQEFDDFFHAVQDKVRNDNGI